MTTPTNPSRKLLRLTLVAGLVLQLLLLIVGATMAIAGGSHEIEFVKPMELEGLSLPIDPESGFKVAKAYASQWAPDARLISVSMRLDWRETGSNLPETELPGRGWIIYVFEHGGATVSLYLDRGTGILIGQNKSGFGGDSWSTLDLTTYPRSSSIAALTANITSGAEYRIACPEYRTSSIVTASLHRGTEGETDTVPIWTVTYGDSRYPGTFDIVVQLDANAGDVITNDVRERPCAD